MGFTVCTRAGLYHLGQGEAVILGGGQFRSDMREDDDEKPAPDSSDSRQRSGLRLVELWLIGSRWVWKCGYPSTCSG